MRMLASKQFLFTVCCLISASAFAESTGTLAVTATVAGSTRLQIAALATTATGIDTAVLRPFPADLQPAGSSHKTASMLLVTAQNANLTSETYTLAARLERQPRTGEVWKINGIALSDQATIVTTAATFNTPEPYQWVVETPDGERADGGLVISITPNK